MATYGLRVVYDSIKDHPSKKAAEIDIVAVHGLNFLNHDNHGEKTWLKGDKLWIRDFLPEALAKPARVMLFSYNSSPAMKAAGTAVDDHARSLLHWLLLERGELSSRPLVFICHSLGGVLVKSALVEATLDNRYRSIRDSTRLLVFFATPHRGGKHASVGDVVAKIVRAGLRRPKNDLVDALKGDSEAANKRFEQARHLPANCLIVSFYETEPYGKAGIIVEKGSATLDLPGNIETQLSRPADHSSICKFDSVQECEFVLKTISKEAESALGLNCSSVAIISPPPASPPPAAASENTHWVVPRSANTLFTGRSEAIGRIAKEIATPADVQRRFILTGMGGLGKSEVCLKVASRVRDQFWAVFWVDVGTKSSAEEGFIKIARTLGSSSTALEDALEALSGLPRASPWLLILDNADEQKDYSEYFPSGDRGAIIMTSRDPNCGPAHQTVGWMELDFLELEDGVELLHKAAGSSEQSRQQCQVEVQAVVEALGFHTLAILQAGAYIAGKHCTMAEYPRLLKKHSKRLMQFHKTQEQARYRSAYATMEASMQILESSPDEQASHDALDLLRLLSTLHHEQVPLGFFDSAGRGVKRIQAENNHSEHRIDYLNPWHVSQAPDFLQPDSDTWERYRLNNALSLLVSLALVRRDESDSNESISMHPLTHAWARDRQDLEPQKQSLRTTQCVVALAYDGSNIWQPWWDRFRPHTPMLLHVDTDLPNQAAQSMYVLQTYVQIAWLLREIYLWRDLDAFLRDIFDRLGLDPEVPVEGLLPLYDVAAFNAENQGETKKAIRILDRSTQVASATQDARSQDALWRQFHLASAYRLDGRVKTSVELLEEIVQGDQFAFDELNDPSQRVVEGSLASAYLADDRVNDAISLLQDIVHAEVHLPPNDPSRLVSQRRLAKAYLTNGQVQEAIELMEYVVEVERSSRAYNSNDYLSSKYILAVAYSDNGQVPEAIQLLEQVVEIQQAMFAESNPDRLGSQHALARAYLEDGQVSEAIKLFEHVVAIRKETFDPTHHQRLTSQHELARAYLEDNRVSEAINLFEYVVALQEQTLDPTHHNRLISQHILARAYLKDNRVLEAVNLLEHVVAVKSTTLSEDNKSRILSQRLLDDAYERVNGPSRSTSISEDASTLPEAEPKEVESGGREMGEGMAQPDKGRPCGLSADDDTPLQRQSRRPIDARRFRGLMARLTERLRR